jgi:hypothetical protein
MSTFFRIESKDVGDLNSLQLTKLLKLLLCLEARTFGISEKAIDVGLNISVPDGGEDGRIEWSDEPNRTDYLPNQFVQFQIKATEMGPTDCANEIVRKDGSLKPMIEEALSSGASYILFVSQTLNKEQKDERITKIREKLASLNKQYASTAIIDIYDASKIESWVNKYIPAIVAVMNWVGRPLVSGLKTWNDWSSYREYQRFPFIADNERESALVNLRGILNKPKECARIVGLSGLGKTRLAFEVFRRNDEAYNDMDQRVVYTDAGGNEGHLNGWISDCIQSGLEGIIVVDNCESSLHSKLRQEIQRSDSKLSLLTLDYNMDKPSYTYLVRLRQMEDQYVKKMLEPVYGGLIADLDRIIAFAQGFPQMAVLLADARLDREPEMGSLTDDHIADKMLWGGKERNDKHERILKGCALFDRFGLEEDGSIEYKFIATEVVQVDIDEFYDCVKKFEDRGLVDRRGRFARIVPKPLAIRMAAEWWRRNSKERTLEIINAEMPGGLIESFCDQIKFLDFLPEVKILVRDLCGPQGPFGQAEVILSNRGSLLFRALVEVNPEATSQALSNIINKLTQNELMDIKDDIRRNIVWALEKLCFHKTCFEQSAITLLLLASAENEKWANNASGQFIQLFQTFLSGTEASPDQRMRVIDYALSSQQESMRRIAVEALESVIKTHTHSRGVGAEYQGSGEPLQEWRPKVWGEAFKYWDEALQRLFNLVSSKDPLAAIAKNKIATHIRGLMQHGRIDSLDSIIQEIVKIDGPFWPRALESIDNSLRYEGDSMPPEGKIKLKEWITLLTPKDLHNKLRLYVTLPPYEHEMGEDGHYIDLAMKNAQALAIELSQDVNCVIPYLKELMIGEQRMAHWFAKNLILANQKWEPLLSNTIESLINIETPNINFLLGILSGIFDLDPSSWEKTVSDISKVDALVPYYANIVNSGKATENQLKELIKLTANGSIPSTSLVTFMYGKSLDHLNRNIVCQFVSNLSDISGSAGWVALDILSMYCYSENDRWEQCRPTFVKIVLSVPLDNNQIRVHHDIYTWHQVVDKLISTKDEEFIKLILNKIIDSSDLIDYGDIWNNIQPLLRKMFQMSARNIWPILSKAIRDAEPIKRYRFTHLLGDSGAFNKGAPSLLADLPDDLLREWCSEYPDLAPVFVAETTDVLLKTNEGVRLSPRAKFLLDNFGENKKVLSALSANFGSFGWTGSLVPYLQREINALEVLKTHEKKSVREWVNSRLTYLNESIERERRRDEEHDWNIY